jgi:DNA-binding response OmpR family regulator
MEAKLLIVEDDECLRSSLQDYFEREGFCVAVAQDGNKATSMLSQVQPDLIILDVQLPCQDGLEVCAVVRRQFGQSIGIIMISGIKKEDVDQTVGLEVGADVYLIKPVKNHVLRAQVRAILRRIKAQAATGPAAGWFVVDDYLRIHFDGRQVQISGQDVDLAPLEFDLLKYLVHHAGEACSKADMIDAVWGPGTIVSDTAVSTCISRLRNKIEPDLANPRYIQSVYGVGYRFEAF